MAFIQKEHKDSHLPIKHAEDSQDIQENILWINGTKVFYLV